MRKITSIQEGDQQPGLLELLEAAEAGENAVTAQMSARSPMRTQEYTIIRKGNAARGYFSDGVRVTGVLVGELAETILALRADIVDRAPGVLTITEQGVVISPRSTAICTFKMEDIADAKTKQDETEVAGANSGDQKVAGSADHSAGSGDRGATGSDDATVRGTGSAGGSEHASAGTGAGAASSPAIGSVSVGEGASDITVAAGAG